VYITYLGIVKRKARKKENRTAVLARIASGSPEKLKGIAFQLGYQHNNKGSIGKMLDAIASGKIILIKVDNPE
jgi:hypothetical protein